MRTTLDIADDVLAAAKERARREHKTAGQVVSELLRMALTTPVEFTTVREAPAIYGLRPFEARGNVVTNEFIDRLRDDDAY